MYSSFHEYGCFINRWSSFRELDNQPFIRGCNLDWGTRRVWHKKDGSSGDGLCDHIESKGKKLADINALTESVKIMIAGRISRENNGEEVKLSDIPDTDPGFDGKAFEKGYAAKVKGK